MLATGFTGVVHSHAAEVTRTETKVFKCVRNIVEGGKADKAALLESAAVLKGFKEKTDPAAMLKKCEAIKDTIGENKERTISEVETDIEELFKNKSIDVKEYHVIHGFNSPYLQCKLGGAEVDAAVILGMGIGMSAGKCRSESGRVFFVAVPNASFDVGLLLGAMIQKFDFTIKSGDWKVDGDSLFFIGLGAATKFNPRGYSSYEANGIGIGFGINGTGGILMKALPLGNNFKKLKEILVTTDA